MYGINWKEVQDTIRKKHEKAKPNEKEFWFSNIKDRLDYCQEQLMKEKSDDSK